MSMKAIFKKIGEAKVRGSGQYFVPGDYVAILEKMFFLEGQDGDYFIAEHRIETSKKTEANDPSPAGSKRTFMTTLNNAKAKGADRANAKEYICILVGADPETIDEKSWEELLAELFNEDGSEKTSMRGKRIRIEAWDKLKKEAKGKENPVKTDYFTRHTFTHVEETDEQVAATAKSMGPAPAAEPAK